MPGGKQFSLMGRDEWRVLESWIRGSKPKNPWSERLYLQFCKSPPKEAIEGVLVGGNLSVLASLVGTPFAVATMRKILFIEDVDEPLYRIDRMASQLADSGSMRGLRALVLGNFLNCKDIVSVAQDKPLRRKLDERKIIPQIFGRLADRYGIPLLYHLPVGHGPGQYPLPLGATYRISVKGEIELLEWDWLRKQRSGGQRR
ncbi:MAG: hypothetical protein AABZ06_11890, partial [Bdellovibrionota bacterium]